MLLTIDVGNTNIVLGLFEGDKLIRHFRLTTGTERSKDEFGIIFLQYLACAKAVPEDIDGVIISSVVPQVMYSLERAISEYIKKKPIVVTNDMELGIKILYDNPSEVGADRIVNAVAGYSKYGGPLIIVDFGTATTFCAITERGEYLGGAICPGIKISVDALFERTAKLPKIELAMPPSVIGKTTVQSMQAGILFGYVGQVDYIVDSIKKEMGIEKCAVIATGGLARMISKHSKAIEKIDPFLTLEGLHIIYERIRNNSRLV